MHYAKVIQEQLIIDCYQSVALCCVSARFLPLDVCPKKQYSTQRNKSWDFKNIHLITPIKLVNISTPTGLPSSSSSCIPSSQWRGFLLSLEAEQKNLAPLLSLWIKAATFNMNARTWWSDYFNNT